MLGRSIKTAVAAVSVSMLMVGFSAQATANVDPVDDAVQAQVRLSSAVDKAQLDRALLSKAKGQVPAQQAAVTDAEMAMTTSSTNMGQIARDIARGDAIGSDPLLGLVVALSDGDSLDDIVTNRHMEQRVAEKFGGDVVRSETVRDDAQSKLDQAVQDVERLETQVTENDKQVTALKTEATAKIQALAEQESATANQTTTVQQSVRDTAAEQRAASTDLTLASISEPVVAEPGNAAASAARKRLENPEPVVEETQPVETLPAADKDPAALDQAFSDDLQSRLDQDLIGQPAEISAETNLEPVEAPEALQEAESTTLPPYPCVAVAAEAWSDYALPSTPAGILSVTQRVEPDAILPGDLVFQFEHESQMPHGVGIYIGGGQMVSTMMNKVAVQPWEGDVITRPSLGLLDTPPIDNQIGERLACGDLSSKISPTLWVEQPSEDGPLISQTGGVVVSVVGTLVTVNHGYGFIGLYDSGVQPEVREGQIVLPGTPLAPSSETQTASIKYGERVIDPTGWGTYLNPGGYSNGTLDESLLCEVQGYPGHKLRCDAARSLAIMAEAYLAETGTPMALTDSYRSLQGQIDVKALKGFLAATPGSSVHGWGLAVDFSGGIEIAGSAPHVWMQQNAHRFGWEHPDWAQANGSKPEAWHWEFGASRLATVPFAAYVPNAEPAPATTETPTEAPVETPETIEETAE